MSVGKKEIPLHFCFAIVGGKDQQRKTQFKKKGKSRGPRGRQTLSTACRGKMRKQLFTVKKG